MSIAAATREQINALRFEAEAHSDPETVQACDRALEGDPEALREVAEVLQAAIDAYTDE